MWISATATRRGVRPYNCDAALMWRADDRTVAVVVDGIGNSAEVAANSALLADVAARVAADRGGMAGLLSASGLLNAPADDREDPDAVAVLAVAHPDVAVIHWIGDARAYGWDGVELRQYTTDHTVGEQLRRNGVALDLAADHDNWVRTTVGRATVATVYEAQIPSEQLVLLTSDGVHDQMSHQELTALVREHHADPQRLADALVDAARPDETGYRDDATAVVLSLTKQ
ncbi:PP2C family protein-serine/threonine phosphatase [Streptosporangium saharense]|uniref:Protein phosphatase n=1 Tax=Streptosporangium saharense TaxID=1706840 RepID=A0A7W7QPI9_9ACTN|nr:SpoIIE family protein phosphatase [Streptosporangium saharense]MBB4917406.1 protein phosphatase [Streptosporangium saharense]